MVACVASTDAACFIHLHPEMRVLGSSPGVHGHKQIVAGQMS
jgi:hypothetical protein